jgi:hypothetical protein
MVTELRIYFEGDARLRPGFRRFLDEIYGAAKTRRCRVELVATDGTPVQDYSNGLKANPQAWNVLLLDSDAPASAFAEMCTGKRIEASKEGSVFWMVQIMESWFLADVSALRKYFGKRFREAATTGNPKVEEIPKVDVISRLNAAAGGEYHKVKDGTNLLARIDPSKLRTAAPNCERMFSTILGGLK